MDRPANAMYRAAFLPPSNPQQALDDEARYLSAIPHAGYSGGTGANALFQGAKGLVYSLGNPLAVLGYWGQAGRDMAESRAEAMRLYGPSLQGQDGGGPVKQYQTQPVPPYIAPYGTDWEYSNDKSAYQQMWQQPDMTYVPSRRSVMVED